MQLHILNSGSVGNCYILDAGHTALIIECGVNMTEIMKGIGFNPAKVAGVLVSHEHGDHCKAIKQVLAGGMNTYCSAGTIEALGLTSHRLFPVKAMQTYTIDEFKVMPFNVKHDCNEPMGFIIHHKQCGNVLFITDTYYVPNKFKNLNNILVEANYCQKIVDQRLADGNVHAKVRDRVLTSHMSIDTCLELLKANDLSAVNNIVLIHLSDKNSNAEEFKQRVQQQTGKTVHVAGKNMSIPFGITPF